MPAYRKGAHLCKVFIMVEVARSPVQSATARCRRLPPVLIGDEAGAAAIWRRFAGCPTSVAVVGQTPLLWTIRSSFSSLPALCLLIGEED